MKKNYNIKYNDINGITEVVVAAESFRILNGDIYIYGDDPNLPIAFYSNVVLVEETSKV